MIYVPYKDNTLLEDVDKVYNLYSIEMNYSAAHLRLRGSTWGLPPFDPIELIEEKFKGLQKYFNYHHYENYHADFYIKTDLTNGTPKNVEGLDKHTTSVFLGLFLTAELKIKRRKFKKNWKLICVTGDLEYDENKKTLNLCHIDDPEKKFENKFFEKAKKCSGECLFLYINNEEKPKEGELQGKNKNITVKRFSEENDINEIIDYLFVPLNYKTDLFEYEPEQQRLLSIMEKSKENNINYIQGNRFDILEKTILTDPNWHGFLIRGEAGCGKSALAMEIARCLVGQKRLFAPIWIKILDSYNNLIEDIISDQKLEANEDDVKKYIISNIYKQLINNENKSNNEITINEMLVFIIAEFKIKKYLIIIDNLELLKNDTIDKLKFILSDQARSQYLIITSRSNYSTQNLFSLKIREQIIPKLTFNKLIDFVDNIVNEMGDDYSKKIKSDKDFKELLKVLNNEFIDNPDLIITSINQLRNKSVIELSDEIRIRLGGKDKSIREKRIQINEIPFSNLNIIQKQVLYSFLSNIRGNKLVSISDILHKLQEKWDKNEIIPDLNEILEYLVDSFLIYSEENNGETQYGIKKLTYINILLEKEYLGPLTKSGEYLRDVFIDLRLQIERALQYDQRKEIISNLLNKINKNNIEINKEKLIFIAARCSSDREILDLLYNFGSDINSIMIDGFFNITPFAWAMIFNSNMDILKWFCEKSATLKFEHSILGGNIFFQLVSSKEDVKVIDWLYNSLDYAKKMIISSDKNGQNIFHHTIAYGIATTMKNVVILDWLYNKIELRELLDQPDKQGCTVWHYAAGRSNNNILNWLKEKPEIKKMIKQPDNHGNTAFHYALINNNYDVLNWFSDNTDWTLGNNKNGFTIFHYTAKFGNVKMLNWLLDHAPNEYIIKLDKNNQTVFHAIAERKGYILLKNLNPMFNNTDDEKYFQQDDIITSKLRTHYSCIYYNKKIMEITDNIDVIEIFYKKAKDIINYRDINGLTFLHVAAHTDNDIFFKWYFDKDNEEAKKLLNFRDNKFRTVYDIAKESKSIKVQNWFEKYLLK